MHSSDSGVFRSGFVALAGRPNAGKSSLLNAMLGQKLAIATPVAQTTRTNLRAIITSKHAQLIITDTPGLHKPKDSLGSELNNAALAALTDADCICHVMDMTKEPGRGDDWVCAHIVDAGAPFAVLLFTKADLCDQEMARQRIAEAKKRFGYDEMLVSSAKTGFNIDALIRLLSEKLPEGPLWYPAEATSDVSDEDLVASFVQEKLFFHLKEELPYRVGVLCESIEERSKRLYMEVSIYVERASQKAIILGKGGSMIKRIGIEARSDLQRTFGQDVYLSLTVKVLPHWRDDLRVLRRMGYAQ